MEIVGQVVCVLAGVGVFLLLSYLIVESLVGEKYARAKGLAATLILQIALGVLGAVGYYALDGKLDSLRGAIQKYKVHYDYSVCQQLPTGEVVCTGNTQFGH